MRSGDDPEHSASTTCDHKLGSLIEQCRNDDLNVYHVKQYRDYDNYVDVLDNLVNDLVGNFIDLKLDPNNELIQFRSRAGQSSPKHGVDPDNNCSTDRFSGHLLCKQHTSTNSASATTTLPPQQTTNEGYRAAAGYMLYPLGLLGGYLAVV
ncbi:hypothetical protein LTR56_000991 [Elasticomyces elasticus]|nr:hypothetical protein LTR22_013207 [Elasticomyces elasticus]KAK3660065.1 hypothetical protein LTR56_000991 [Elasticomyces elasticus]KAK4911066.1 hypothetical protein LTR49_020329 [Elasticomyces elasticus]KAK5750528.1 hypothetical protein LTS12_019404 [Elasticomyces elasticus]